MQNSAVRRSPARRFRRSRLWKPSLCLACGAISAVATLFVGESAKAANDTWVGSTSANWSGTNGFTTAPVSGFTPVFGVAGAAGTTLNDDLAAGFSVGGITFNAGASSYTISGNSLTLNGNIGNSTTSGTETINDALILGAAVTVSGATGSSTILGGAISGAFTLTDSSTGTVTFSSANSTFSGATTVTLDGVTYTEGVYDSTAGSIIALGASSNSGTLANGPLGTGALYINAALTLEATGGAQSIGNQVLFGNVSPTIGGGSALTVNGLVVFGGSDTVTISNSALTTFAGGVQIGKGSNATRNATFAGAGNLTINSAITNGPSGFGAGSLIYTGTGTLTLSSTANAYTGSTTVSQGTLALGGSAPSGSAGVLGNATTAVALGSTTLTGAASIVTNGSGFTIARNIAETTGPLTNALLSIGGTQTSGTSIYTGNIGLTKNTTLTSAHGGEVDFTTGVISGAFNVAIDGGGLVKLTGANTFGSATAHANSVTIQGGATLNVASAGTSLGAAGNDLVFNNGTLQFGGVFDPSASRSMTFNSGGAGFDTFGNTITFASPVGNGGAGGLTLNDSIGTGKLVLSAVNTYTGGTTVTAGSLQLSGAGTLGGTSGGLTVNTGGTLDLNGTSQSVGNLTGTGGTILDNNASTTSTLNIGTGNGTGGSYGGVIANGNGNVALTKNGSGTIALAGANTYTGATTINGGILSLGTGGSLGGTAVNVAAGTLQIGSTGSTATTTIGTGGAASVSVSSGLSLANGALNSLAINSSTAGATVLTLNAATLTFDIGGAATSDSDQINLGSGLLASSSGSNVIDLNIIGTGLNGTTQELISWSGYTGTGTYSEVTTSGSAGGYTLSLTATSSGLFLNESSTSSAFWKGASNSSWATINNFTTDLAGTTPRSASLDSNTAVTFIANGGANYSNTTLDGSYSINSLTFNTGGVGIANGTGTNTLTLASSSGISVATGVGTSPESISANLVLGSTQGWSVADANSVLNVSGNVSGPGASLTKAGNGTLILSGTNSYSGSTTVSAGTLNVQSSGALGGTSGVSVTTGATLQLQGGITTSGSPSLTLNGTGTGTAGALQNVSGANTYSGLITLGAPVTIGSDAGTLSLSNVGTITGLGDNLTLVGAGNGAIASIIGTASGSLTMSGTGSWTLSGANTYTGSTIVSSGSLVLSGAGTLGATSGGLTVNGGTLDLGGTSQTVGNFTGTGGTVTDNGAAATLTIGTGNATGGNYAGNLTQGSGVLSLTKVGTGTLTLSGANTVRGATTISAGALNIAGSSGLGTGAGSASSGVSVASGAALQLTGGITTPSVVGVTLNGTGVAAVPNGALENVSGNNTFSGAVTLGSASTIGSDAGTLTLNSSTAITAPAGPGNDLTFTGAGNGLISSTIGIGSNNLDKSGTGVLTISGANTYTGATNITAGTLIYNSIGALSNSSGINLGSLAVAANLTYAGTGGTMSDPVNFSGTTGTVTLGNSGSGAIVYSATPTFTAGAKTIILGNATDSVGGSIGGITDTGAGAVSLSKAGLTNSTWTLTGAGNTHTGQTSVLGGVLADTTLSDLSTSYIVLAGSSALNYGVLQTNGTITRTLSGTANASNLSWGANSGFAAQGGTLTLNFSGGAAQQWTIGGFIAGSGGAGAMVYGSTTSDSQVVLQNSFDFGQTGGNLSAGYNRTIDVEGAAAAVAGGTSNFGVTGSNALISGAITANEPIVTTGGFGDSGDNGFVKTGPGTLILSGANTYSGVTFVNGGTLIAGTNALAGSAGAFGDGHSVTPSTGGSATVTGNQIVVLGNGNQNGGAVGGNDGTTATGASPTLLIGGNFTVADAIDIGGAGVNNTTSVVTPSGTITTTGTYGIGGSTANSSTFSGLITSGQNFSVTQVAGGTLNITGGITGIGAGTKIVTFNDAGAVNVNTTGIVNGAGTVALTKSNSGTLTLGVASSYTGATTVNGGTLSFAVAGVNGTNNGGAVTAGTLTAAAPAITVTGGTALISANNALGPSTTVTLSGGAIGVGNGVLQGQGGNVSGGAYAGDGSMTGGGVGALTLTANSTLSFAGSSGTILFGNQAPGNNVPFTPNGFILNVTGTNFSNGTSSSDGVNDRLIFASDETANLGDFDFNGVPGAKEIALDSGFEIIPNPTAVPEPATWLAGGLLAGVCGLRLRRRSSALDRVS